MLKIVWMTDLHFRATGDVLGHDPRLRLDLAIDHINSRHNDADLCIVTGDMVDEASDRNYAALAKRLRALRIPVYPLVGNHDDRELLKTHLPVPDTCMPNFVQYAVEIGETALLCLDSQKPGEASGEFCNARYHWLAAQLNRFADRPVVLFMHHPPMPLGLPVLDDMGLENGDLFLDFLAAFPNVLHLCLGHVHRPITGTIGGIRFSTLQSVLYQAPPARPVWGLDSFAPAREAPALAVITGKNEGLIIQSEAICPFEKGGHS